MKNKRQTEIVIFYNQNGNLKKNQNIRKGIDK